MGSDYMEDFRFSYLPEDVGKLVFEFVAEMDEETGRSCALISSKIKFWVEPILYRTIIIRTPSQLRSLCRTIQHPGSSKPRNFFNLHVKALVISDIYADDDPQHLVPILVILKACQKVERLVLWVPTLLVSQEPSSHTTALQGYLISPELSPSRVSILSSLLPGNQVRFSYPIFQNTTHLEVWTDHANQDWNAMQHLPRLTHLSVLVAYTVEECPKWVKQIIGFCPSLQVFIFWLSDSCLELNREFADVRAIDEGEVDVRAVVAYILEEELGPRHPGMIIPSMDLIIRGFDDIVRDFAGIPVGKDFWTLAEERIEERLRHKALQPQSHD